MFKLPESFDLEEDGYMDQTFSVRLPKKVEPMLNEMIQKGVKVGPKLRPYIADMVQTLYKDWTEKQRARTDEKAS